MSHNLITNVCLNFTRANGRNGKLGAESELYYANECSISLVGKKDRCLLLYKGVGFEELSIPQFMNKRFMEAVLSRKPVDVEDYYALLGCDELSSVSSGQ